MKIDVAMTCYDCKPWLDEAIGSVAGNSYEDWVIYFVDDASTDGSFEWAFRWQAELGEKFVPVRRFVNGGYGPCLKDAIEIGSGELVAIVDADDAIEPHALARMVEEHERNPEAAVVYSRSWWCNQFLTPYKYGPSGPIPEGMTLLDCLDGGPKSGRVSHLKVLKRKFYEMTEGVGNLRKRIDKDLMLKMEEVGKLVFIPDVLYFYRDRPGNLTNLYFKMPEEERERIAEQSRKILENAKKRRGIK